MPEVDLTAAEQSRIDELFGLVQSGTFYDLLGVPHDADAKAVQAAYYEMSRAWHPDRYFRRELGPYRERLETVFADLTRAYRTLSNETERIRYNRDLEDRGIKIGRPKLTRPAASSLATTAPSPPAAPPTASPPPTAPPSPVVAAPPPPVTPVEPVMHEAALNRPKPGAPSAPPPAASRPATASQPPRPATSSIPPRAAPNPLVNAMREQVRERLEKARRYYQTGKEDYEAGRFVKASGALKLALELDPKNETYLKLAEEARIKARAQQAESLITQGRAALENMKEPAAIDFFRRALEYEPDDPSIYFRVGKWVLDKENDQRQALHLFRKAVEKKPDSAEYRLALADLYVTLKMELNAKREYQFVLDRDKKNERAKAGLAKLR